MNVGDIVEFHMRRPGWAKWFREDCDVGVIVAKNACDRKRPFRVRWNHGVETWPTATCLRLRAASSAAE